MAKVLHGDTSANQLNVSVDKTQAYGLKGNDTLVSDGKSDVLLVGGGGDDGLFKVTLKSVRDNDYFDDEASRQVWQVLELTNQARENANASLEAAASLSPLTLSDGLTEAASIRAEEITELGERNELNIFRHIRPNRPADNNKYETVFEEVGKEYHHHAENIQAGASSPEEVMNRWMNSPAHRENILTEDFKKLGVGYNEDDTDPSDQRFYWLQLFADSLNGDNPGNFETVTAAELLNASIEPNTVSKFITLTEGNDTRANNLYGVTISALGGNDSISNSGLNVSISGGADDDTIENSGSFGTINAGTGDDQINLSDDAQEILIEYFSGGGNDSVSGLNSTDTLSISGSEFTPATVGNDIIVGVGSDSITLTGAASSGVQIVGTRSKLLIGTEDADYLNNSDDAATIIAKGGDDYIYNGGENVLFFQESGNDTIGGFNETSTLKIAGGSLASGTSGDDLILFGSTDSIKILGAASFSLINIVDADDNPVEIGDTKDVRGTEQADSLRNAVDGASIRALGGDDTIDNKGAQVSIFGGAGNDSVNNNQKRGTIYIYESGNDSIDGFNDSDTLDLGDRAWETVESDNGILVNIIENEVTVGSVTLKDYPSDQQVYPKSSYVKPAVPGEDIYNITNSTLITGTANDDTIENRGNYVTINALGGNDSIRHVGGSNVSIDSGSGNDEIFNNANGYVSIDAGAGNDSIRNFSNYVTIEGGEGYDTISNIGSKVLIIAGEGNDYIENDHDNVTIFGGDGNDLIDNIQSDSVTIDGGAGNDFISNDYGSNVSISAGDGDDSIFNYNGFNNVSIYGGSGNDYIYNWKNTTDSGDLVTIISGDGDDTIENTLVDNVSIDTGAGNDSIVNYSGSNVSIDGGVGNDYIVSGNGDSVTIDGGAGDDSIHNDGSNVSINSGIGNDSILNTGSNVSIFGGTGDDSISLSSYSKNNFIRYADGNGNDTVWGITGNDTLNILAEPSAISSLRSGEDIIVRVGEGEILLVGVRNHPPHITIGESGTSGGPGTSTGSPGSSGTSGTSSGQGSNTSGGTSASANSNSDASGGQSASGSSGTSASSGGNGSSGRGNSSSTAGSSITNPITIPENLSTTSTTRTTTNYNPLNTSVTTTQGTYSGTKMSPVERTYTGGNKIIKHYGSWRKITFEGEYKGAHFDGAGNFIVESSTGHLVFENATDKVINLKDAAGNDFIKAHMSSSAGTVDGRIYSGYQILNGSLGEDLIFAGADGSQLWGNADTAADTLVGGDGADIFVSGKNEGSDTFQNASSADVINLNDTSLSDIVSTNTRDGALVLSFNTGNTLTVQSTEALSANIVFSDGATRRFNHATNSWQTE